MKKIDKIPDAWRKVKKSLTSKKKADWMTREKRNLSSVKPISKKK